MCLCRHLREDCVTILCYVFIKRKAALKWGVQAVTYAHTHWKLPSTRHERVERTLCATFKKKVHNIRFKDSLDKSGGDSLFFGDEFKKRNFQILKFLQRALTDDIKWNWKYDSEKVTNIVIIQIRHTLFNALSYSTRKLSLRKWKWI